MTGPRTLLATVASWDTTLSTPDSAGGTGELELELELEVDEEEALRLAAASAAHSLRLSASFFCLGMPGEEQAGRGASRGSVEVWGDSVVFALEPGDVVVVAVDGAVVLGPSEVGPSALGSDGAVLGLRLFRSWGGVGLRNVSLLTEMNALPGVEKGRGP